MKKSMFVLLIMLVIFLGGCTRIGSSLKGLQSDTMGLNRNIYVSMDDGNNFCLDDFFGV